MTLLEIADLCESGAAVKLTAYIEQGKRHSNYDGSDRLDDAEKLLNCAAALRTRSTQEGDKG